MCVFLISLYLANLCMSRAPPKKNLSVISIWVAVFLWRKVPRCKPDWLQTNWSAVTWVPSVNIVNELWIQTSLFQCWFLYLIYFCGHPRKSGVEFFFLSFFLNKSGHWLAICFFTVMVFGDIFFIATLFVLYGFIELKKWPEMWLYHTGNQVAFF